MDSKDSKMKIYEQLRHVPVEATKPIDAGRLAGMTSVTPQWRYQRLTELFGPCGVGWKVSTPEYNFWKLEDKAQAIVFCSVNLYIRGDDGSWSDPIPGEGGSLLYVRNYKTNEFEPNDDAKKSALTDAIGTAAKLLGLGADIYFRTGDGSKYRDDTDRTPYGVPEEQPAPAQASPQTFAPPVQPPMAQSGYQQKMPSSGPVCADCGRPITESMAAKSFHEVGRPLCMTCLPGAKGMTMSGSYAPAADAGWQMPNQQMPNQQMPVQQMPNQQMPVQQMPKPIPVMSAPQHGQSAMPQPVAPQAPVGYNPAYDAPAAPGMTREQALAYVFPNGEYQGKTVGDIIAAGKSLDYYRQARFQQRNPELYEAVNVALGN